MPIEGGNVTDAGTVTGTLGGGNMTDIDIDAAGRALAIDAMGNPLGADGMPLEGITISETGFASDADGNPVALDSAGNTVAFDMPGGSVLGADGMPITGASLDGNGTLTGPGGVPLPIDGMGNPVAVDAMGSPVDAMGVAIPAARGLPDGTVEGADGAVLDGLSVDAMTGAVSGADGAAIPGAMVSGPDGTFTNPAGNPIAGADIVDGALVDASGSPVDLAAIGADGDAAAPVPAVDAPLPSGAADGDAAGDAAGTEAGDGGEGEGDDLSGGEVAGIVIGCVLGALLICCCFFAFRKWRDGQRNGSDAYQSGHVRPCSLFAPGFCSVQPVTALLLFFLRCSSRRRWSSRRSL